jgi:hypothetical protein
MPNLRGPRGVEWFLVSAVLFLVIAILNLLRELGLLW